MLSAGALPRKVTADASLRLRIYADMRYVRRGVGKPLLLIHGLGGSWRSWQLVLDDLAAAGREVIALDLPGHGESEPLTGESSIRTLADAVTEFLRQENLLGIDAVGSSMGARLVLELARRGVLGAVVSLDPGGFWKGWEIPAFYYPVAASVRLVRLLQPAMPFLTASRVARTILFAQFSARPWKVPAKVALDEMRAFAASPSFDELLYELAYGERQQGAQQHLLRAPLAIVWGRQDRVCLPRQAYRAKSLFPDATLHWFAKCGHFPHWDKPAETVRLILAVTSGQDQAPVAKTEPVTVLQTSSRRPAGFAAAAVAILAGSLFLLRR